MHYVTCKVRRCPHTEDHCLPVFPCSRNYPYLLSALPKCSCPFSCSLTSFKLPLFPCSPVEIDHVPLFQTLSYCLGSLDKYDSLRSSWLDYTLEPHVLSAICSYSFEPHVRFVLEITSKMTWCSARPRRVQICNEGVSF